MKPGRLLAAVALFTLLFPGFLPAQTAASPYRAQPYNPKAPTPKHAYSPFDDPAATATTAPALTPADYTSTRVMIRLKPEALAMLSGPQKMSGSTFGVAGLGAVARVFPTAQAPIQKASADPAAPPPPPDLRLWLQGDVSAGANIPQIVADLKKNSLVATAEPDLIYRLSELGSPSPVSSESPSSSSLKVSPKSSEAPAPSYSSPLPAPSYSSPLPTSPSLQASSQSSASSDSPSLPPSSAASAIPDGSLDPLFAQQWHLDGAAVKQAWANLASRGFPAGGARDVVIAVIDTGVDYNHPDLAPNRWVNSQEIAGDGIDNDGNGIVDDVYGANFVGGRSGNPMDDMGHGTHVAGIIAAAANNGVGGVGVAYNCQIMALKAANSSGQLAASDIATAINYAVEKGADVINMSFGGSSKAQVIEDALLVAATRCTLVAAAGNSSKATEAPAQSPRPFYPSSYPFVLGVMAQKQTPSANGDYLAAFSNWDSVPGSRTEYEIMAPGTAILSTLPNNQYAAWNGTSMATPVVSGIAALVRTAYPNRTTHNGAFIASQVLSAATPLQGITPPGGTAISYPALNGYAPMVQAPAPKLAVVEYIVFDSPSIAPGNNGNGIIDAGETVDLLVVVRNNGGKANPVSVKVEPRATAGGALDPYVTMITDTVDYGAIGDFNEDDNGLLYTSGVASGVAHPFRFTVSSSCPNDHVIPLLVTASGTNGYNPGDPHGPYVSQSTPQVVVQKGRVLPTIITADLTMGPDNYWIVDAPVLIPAGITVNVLPGTQIQFWSSDPNETYLTKPLPYLQVEGELILEGTEGRPIELFPNSLRFDHPVCIVEQGAGRAVLRYFSLVNPHVGHPLQSGREFISEVSHGFITQRGELHAPNVSYLQIWLNANNCRFVRFYSLGVSGYHTENLSNPNATLAAISVTSKREYCLFDSCRIGLDSYIYTVTPDVFSDGSFVRRSVFLKNFTTAPNGAPQRSLFRGLTTTPGMRSYNENAILNQWWRTDSRYWMLFISMTGGSLPPYLPYLWSNNYWGGASNTVVEKAIVDKDTNFSLPDIVIDPMLTTPPVDCWPFVADVRLSNLTQTGLTRVGAETVAFTVTYNRDMSTAVQPVATFGPLDETTKYRIAGTWQNARTWRGTFPVNASTGDGYNYIRVVGGQAADDAWLVAGDDDARFRFEVVTSGVEALTLQANGGEGYVDLSWTQDDFELLAGYNVYRSTSETGSYTKINSSIIPAATKQFRDIGVEPGRTYYYKFTVVQTDFAESQPSNIAQGTPVDTIKPVIAHTPIATGEPNLSLSFTATITDNIRVTGAMLYYRTQGQTAFQSRTLVNISGNQWVVALEGSLVTAPGIEYYLAATDGVSTAYLPSPSSPLLITVLDKPVITGVSPATGTIAGGETITITGSNFKAGARVFFGGVEATNVVVVSPSQITARAPAAIPAKISVRVEGANGLSSTLVNAYTFIDSSPTLTLADLVSSNGAIVTMPLGIANANGLVAAQLTVSYSAALLRVRQASLGSLLVGWQLVGNTATSGQIVLSMAAGSGSVQGSGVMANLEFDVLGNPGQVAPLTFTTSRLNDGAITPQVLGGSVTVNVGYNLGGRLSYWADSARVVPGVIVTLEGNGTRTTTTAADGTYGFTSLPELTYGLTPSKSDPVEAAAITAYDAGLVLRHAAGLATLAGSAITAADVNLNAEISPMDAYYILRQSAGLESIAIPTGGKPWTFSPATRTYAPLNSNRTAQDFAAILRGDVSGNWGSVNAQSGAAVKLGLATTTDATANKTYAYVLLQADAVPVLGLDLALVYNAAQTTLLDISAPSASSALNTGTTGRIRAALAKGEGLTGNQVLLVATFAGTANPQLAFESVSLNEGAVLWTEGVTLAAFDHDGDGAVDPYGAPTIKTQPAPQAANIGQLVNLAVVAAGNPALSYQWRKGGTAIPGATTATLSFAAVQLADAGSYDVVVSNSVGSVTSAAAALGVSKASQTITFAALPSKPLDSGSFTLAATASSGLPVTYTTLNPSSGTVATVSGNTVTLVNTGTITIRASQAGDANTNPATPVEQVLTVLNQSQTITFDAAQLPAKTFGDAPFTIQATSNRGLLIGFVSSNPAVATVGTSTLSGGVSTATVTIAGAGTANLTAQQAGDANTASAPEVVRSLTVANAAQTISFGVLQTRAVGAAPFALTATASSGLPVGYASSNPAVATVSGAIATIVGQGTTVITASQSGNANYLAASDVPQTLTVIVAPSASGTHAVVGGGYVAGGTVTILNTITYTGTLSDVQLQVLLPTGWSFAADGGTISSARPAVGTTGLAEWTWNPAPASPIGLIYALSVPAGTSGGQTLSALVLPRQAGVQTQSLLQPEPLTVYSVPSNHTADSDGNGRLSLVELTRVIEIYNARKGTIRTGRYKVQLGTEDGYAPDPVSTTNQTPATYHSADSNLNGAISLTELTRVIELYNYRSGTTRTGQYHVQAGTEDGFAPGP